MSDVLLDDLGAPVPVPARPPRLVSLVPSLTEALAASYPETDEPLVGATDYCTHPAGLVARRIGGTKNPDVAGIVALAPDLVVANEEENKPEHVAALRAAGLAVWVTDIRDVTTALASLGRLLDAVGAPSRDWLRAAVEAWSAPAPVVPHRRVHAVVPIWRRPWMALGRETYAGDVLARLGVDHVFAGHGERYPRFDLSGLVRGAAGPELAVLPDEPYRFTRDDGPEEFAALGIPSALVDGRALTWYGPAMIDAPTRLADALRSALEAPRPRRSPSEEGRR